MSPPAFGRLQLDGELPACCRDDLHVDRSRAGSFQDTQPALLAADSSRMNVTTDTRSTRIAVFIDFDNVEIGVKTTLGGQFDIGLILEAIKERGEIVTKIAYSDWKRAGDYSRLLTQHAIRMVQRNLTPGGDKNGADINMALDALEMAFTHDHINAFVIVGGDSDFISLVEKLKQYGRKVFVVGGRQFTSVMLQRNCHEFIAYENLVGAAAAARAGRARRRPPVGATSDITQGASAREARAEGAVGPRGDAAARPAQEHAAAARLDVLRARVRRRQLPRLHGEGRADRRGDAEAGRAAACWSSRATTVRPTVDAARSAGSAGRRRRAAAQPRPAPPRRRRPRAGAAASTMRRGRDAAAVADEHAGRHPRRAAGVQRRRRRRRAGRCTCARPSSSCATRSRASTSASTGSRRWSICCAPRARKACCASSAIARAPCACSPVRR